MKKECSIIRDMLPLYFENMVSEDTAEFVKKHIENCPDCAAELKAMKSGKEISETEPSKRESDAKVITAVKKKIAKKIVKTVAECVWHYGSPPADWRYAALYQSRRIKYDLRVGTLCLH